MNINNIKQNEMSDIYDFWLGIQDYGHVYHYPAENLDAPFKKIMDGIAEVQKMMRDSYEM